MINRTFVTVMLIDTFDSNLGIHASRWIPDNKKLETSLLTIKKQKSHEKFVYKKFPPFKFGAGIDSFWKYRNESAEPHEKQRQNRW